MTDLFNEHIKNIQEEIPINKAVLLLNHNHTGVLAAISTWDNGHLHNGLSIKLPSESSLFEKVVLTGKSYQSKNCSEFEGNFFEKKLLLNEQSNSFLLQPLKVNNQVIALIGYSSCESDIFDDNTIIEKFEISHKFSSQIESLLEKITV